MVRWAQPTTGRVAAAAALLWGGKSLQTLHCGASLTPAAQPRPQGAFIREGWARILQTVTVTGFPVSSWNGNAWW